MKTIKLGKLNLQHEYSVEDDFEKDAIKIAKKNGCTKHIKGKKFGTHYPDQLFLTNTGGFFWVEFKLPNNSEQIGQTLKREELQNLGHTCYVINNMTKFIEVLRFEISK